MEPQILIPPPVPIPPSVDLISQEFHKSIVILVLAYIQIGLYVFYLISEMANTYMLSFTPIIFLVPAILIVFTKNEAVYKVSRVLLIIEYLIIPLFIIGLLLLISSW